MESTCVPRPFLRVRDFGSIANLEPALHLNKSKADNNQPIFQNCFHSSRKEFNECTIAKPHTNSPTNFQNGFNTPTQDSTRCSINVSHTVSYIPGNCSNMFYAPVPVTIVPSSSTSTNSIHTTMGPGTSVNVNTNSIINFGTLNDHQYYIPANNNKTHFQNQPIKETTNQTQPDNPQKNLQNVINTNFRSNCFKNKNKSTQPLINESLPIIQSVTSYSPLYVKPWLKKKDLLNATTPVPPTYDQWEKTMRTQLVLTNPVPNFVGVRKRKRKPKPTYNLKKDIKLKQKCVVRLDRIDESKLDNGRLIDTNLPIKLIQTTKNGINLPNNPKINTASTLSKPNCVIEIEPTQSKSIPISTPELSQNNVNKLISVNANDDNSSDDIIELIVDKKSSTVDVITPNDSNFMKTYGKTNTSANQISKPLTNQTYLPTTISNLTTSLKKKPVKNNLPNSFFSAHATLLQTGGASSMPSIQTSPPNNSRSNVITSNTVSAMGAYQTLPVITHATKMVVSTNVPAMPSTNVPTMATFPSQPSNTTHVFAPTNVSTMATYSSVSVPSNTTHLLTPTNVPTMATYSSVSVPSNTTHLLTPTNVPTMATYPSVSVPSNTTHVLTPTNVPTMATYSSVSVPSNTTHVLTPTNVPTMATYSSVSTPSNTTHVLTPTNVPTMATYSSVSVPSNTTHVLTPTLAPYKRLPLSINTSLVGDTKASSLASFSTPTTSTNSHRLVLKPINVSTVTSTVTSNTSSNTAPIVRSALVSNTLKSPNASPTTTARFYSKTPSQMPMKKSAHHIFPISLGGNVGIKKVFDKSQKSPGPIVTPPKIVVYPKPPNITEKSTTNNDKNIHDSRILIKFQPPTTQLKTNQTESKNNDNSEYSIIFEADSNKQNRSDVIKSQNNCVSPTPSTSKELNHNQKFVQLPVLIAKQIEPPKNRFKYTPVIGAKINNKKDKFETLSELFQSKSKLLCTKCGKIVPTSFFWIHVQSQDLFCKICIVEREKPKLKCNTIQDLLENIHKASTELDSSDSETEELCKKVDEILQTVKKVSYLTTNLKRKINVINSDSD